MPLFVANAPAPEIIPYAQRFSSIYVNTVPDVSDDNLIMDMEILDNSVTMSQLSFNTGDIAFSYLLNNTGASVTSATVGDFVTIDHGLGFVPNFVILTPTADGTVYLSGTPTATSFSVGGSAASLTFNWLAE